MTYTQDKLNDALHLREAAENSSLKIDNQLSDPSLHTSNISNTNN